MFPERSSSLCWLLGVGKGDEGSDRAGRSPANARGTDWAADILHGHAEQGRKLLSRGIHILVCPVLKSGHDNLPQRPLCSGAARPLSVPESPARSVLCFAFVVPLKRFVALTPQAELLLQSPNTVFCPLGRPDRKVLGQSSPGHCRQRPFQDSNAMVALSMAPSMPCQRQAWALGPQKSA